MQVCTTDVIRHAWKLRNNLKAALNLQPSDLCLNIQLAGIQSNVFSLLFSYTYHTENNSLSLSHVTGFAKRPGVFHTHPLFLTTLTICNFRLVKAIDLKCAQQHSLMAGESFSFICLFTTKLWSSKFIKLDVCGRPLSQIRSHITRRRSRA